MGPVGGVAKLMDEVREEDHDLMSPEEYHVGHRYRAEAARSLTLIGLLRGHDGRVRPNHLARLFTLVVFISISACMPGILSLQIST